MDQLNERKALTIQQRVKRAQIMRRYKNKLKRAREIASKRFATQDKLLQRATKQARQIVRARFAGKLGANYENLSPSEKITVDRVIENKAALIKKLALRLVPKVRRMEQDRMKSFMSGHKLQNLGAKEGHSGSNIHEEVNKKFKKKFESVKKSASDYEVVQYKKFSEEQSDNSSAYQSLVRKSEKSGVPLELIGEVYDRGLEAFTEDSNLTREQYAFARVNSYVSKGRTYFVEDADLREEQINEISTDMVKRYLLNRGTPAPYYGRDYHQKIRKEYGENDPEVQSYNKDEAKYNAKLKSQERAKARVPGFDREKEMANYVNSSADIAKKYEGKLVHTSDDHPGEGISGYVVGTDPKKDNHVLVSVDVGKGVRGKGINPKETHSVHIDHLKEEIQINEDHFKVGDSVECIKSGSTGQVVKLDPREEGKYYTVKRDDGKTVKYAPDELKLLKEELNESVDDLHKHITNLRKAIVTSSANPVRNVHTQKEIPGILKVHTDASHQKIFDHLKKMGFKKTQGYDPQPNTWTSSTNHDSMASTTDPVHHKETKTSAHLVKQHGGKTEIHFTKWKSINEGKIKDIAFDLDNKDRGNFKKKYGKDKETVRSNLTSKKPIEEGKMTPYVRPHYGDVNNPEKQTAWKASNKHGKTKYFGLQFQDSAKRHAKLNEEGNYQTDALKRLIGTSELVKAFMMDTPGYKKEKKIEEDNLATTHTADYKMTKVRLPDGRVVWRRLKSNYDIIK